MLSSQRSTPRSAGGEEWRLGQGREQGKQRITSTAFLLLSLSGSGEGETQTCSVNHSGPCFGRASLYRFPVSLGLAALDYLDICSPTALARGGRTGLEAPSMSFSLTGTVNRALEWPHFESSWKWFLAANARAKVGWADLVSDTAWPVPVSLGFRNTPHLRTPLELPHIQPNLQMVWN